MKRKLTLLLTLTLTLSLLAGCISLPPADTTMIRPSVSLNIINGTTVPDATRGTESSEAPGTADIPETTTVTTAPETSPEPEVDTDELIGELTGLLADAEPETPIDEAFIRWICETFGETVLLQLQSALSVSGYSRDIWYAVTANSYFVLRDLYTGAADSDGRIVCISTGTPGKTNAATTLTFGGDICFADNYKPMQYMVENGKTITDCIDPLLVEAMQAADIAFMNNEFTISDRGSPLANKAYTFRAATANTALYNTLGIDIVSLANNHAYDYGKDAFLDTLDALNAYDVAAVGGGANLEDAMQPTYYLVNGRKIAFVAASRAEKYRLTPEATSDSPGILRCYDTEKFLQVIRRARANSDFVIACVHWGTEYSATLESVQKTTARDYIDAGADLIVGAHAHQLQGVEYYNGKAIFYNLGNFWFNDKDIDTGLVKVQLFDDGTTRNTFLPARQKGCVTSWEVGTEKADEILAWLEDHSINVTIDPNGVVTEKKNG